MVVDEQADRGGGSRGVDWRQSIGAESPAAAGESQIGHLVLHGRRPQPHRPVRSQAGAEQTRRQAAAGSFLAAGDGDGTTAFTPLWAARRKFKQHGQSGTWVSDWLPEIATCVDDIAVIRSCWADGLNHVGSVCEMNTGSVLSAGRALGSWALYGLGSEYDNLPGYVVLLDYPQRAARRQPQWGTGFMPSTYQGTKFRDGKTPILHVEPPTVCRRRGERRKLDFIQELNRQHLASRGAKTISSKPASPRYELAYRMQSAAPEAVDLSDETAETLRLYGLDEQETATNGRNCLLARRLVERGVRFVQLYMGSGSKWDAHSDVEGNHTQYCQETDQPDRRLAQGSQAPRPARQHAGDLGRRVRPHADERKRQRPRPQPLRLHDVDGRRRHQAAASTYGATDEIGLYAVENKAHVHDIHATILHCWAWITNRSPSTQRPRRTADDHKRSGDQRHYHLVPSLPRSPDASMESVRFAVV